jgi:hypothetical protein
MANPYSRPLQYQYKPLGLDAFAAPLKEMQKSYDVTKSAYEDTLYDINRLEADDDASAALEGKASANLENLQNEFLKTKDYRTAASKLKSLNKEITKRSKGYESNYASWNAAVKEEKEKVAKGDLSEKDFKIWKTLQLHDYKKQGGANYDAATGEYDPISINPLSKDMDKEIQEWAYKIGKANKEDQIYQIGKLDMDDVSKAALIKETREYNNPEDISRAVQSALKNSSRYKDYMNSRDAMYYDYSSLNPTFKENIEGRKDADLKNRLSHITALEEDRAKVANSQAGNKDEILAQYDKAIANGKAAYTDLENSYMENPTETDKSQFINNAYTDRLRDLGVSMGETFGYHKDSASLHNLKMDDNSEAKAKKSKAIVDQSGIIQIVTRKEAIASTLLKDDQGGYIQQSSTGGQAIEDILGNTSEAVDANGNAIAPSGLRGIEEQMNDLDNEIALAEKKMTTVAQNTGDTEAAAKAQEEYDQLVAMKKQIEFSYNEQVKPIISTIEESLVEEMKNHTTDIANNPTRAYYQDRLDIFRKKVKTGEMSVTEFLDYEVPKGDLASNITLDELDAHGENIYKINTAIDNFLTEGGHSGIDDGEFQNEGRVLEELEKLTTSHIPFDFTIHSGGTARDRKLYEGKDEEWHIDHHGVMKRPYYRNKKIAEDKRLKTEKVLEKLGYTLEAVGSPYGHNDIYKTQHNQRYIAVPKDYSEEEVETAKKTYAEKTQINLSVKDVLGTGLKNLQQSLAIPDKELLITDSNKDAFSKLTGGALKNIIDTQLRDTANENTTQYVIGENGQYEKKTVNLSEKQYHAEPNLALFNVASISGVTENGIPILRYSPKEDITNEILFAEADKIFHKELDGLKPQAKAEFRETKEYQKYIKYQKDLYQGGDKKDRYILIGTEGTSLNFDRLEKNLTTNLVDAFKTKDVNLIANATQALVRADMSLHTSTQKRVNNLVQNLFKGNITDKKVDGIKFEDGTQNQDGSNRMVYNRFVYSIEENGNPIVTVERVDGDLNTVIEEGLEKLDFSLFPKDDIPHILRRMEILYGVNSDNLYGTGILK